MWSENLKKEFSDSLGGGKNRFKSWISMILCAALIITVFSGISFAHPKIAEAEESALSNPRIITDSSMEAGQKVTWDCIWFGSYPQAEVVPAGSGYTALSEELLKEGDLIQDDALYQTLQSATGWDMQGDIVIGSEKYRRITKDNATYTTTSFGYYKWKSETEYHYFKYQPIKWRVLSVNGYEAFLLADKALDDKKYHTKYENVTWEGSTIRSWLNGYNASANIQNQDYSSDNFIDTAFETSGQQAIKETYVANKDNLYYGTDGGNDTQDKIFLLSESETYTDAANGYGFVSGYNTDDEARRAGSSVYAKAMGTYSSTSASYVGNCWWWLRSPGDHSDIATKVDHDGWVYRNNVIVGYGSHGVRPALNLNLTASPDAASSNLWSYAGTVCSDGTVDETGKPGGDSGNNMPSGSDEKKLQCSSSCTVEVGHKKSLPVSIYESSMDELKALTRTFKWEPEDNKIATVTYIGCILPVESTKYTSENGTYETWKAMGMVYVQGVSEGKTTVTGTATDGSKITCQVTVTEPEEIKNNDTEGNGGSLELGEDVSGTADSSAGKFFPANWSLKNTNYPISISKSTNEDGSYTIKGTIGIGKTDLLDDEAKWSKYKKNVKNVEKYSGKVDCMKDFKDAYGVKSMYAVSTSKFEVLPKLSVMGYIENKYDKNGNLISANSGVAMDAKWEGSISWQFVTPIGPLYLNLSGSGKLSGKIGVKYGYADKSLKISDGSIKFTPSVALEGGYGIDKVATIGAKGELSIPITIIPASKGEFKAEASIHVKLVFVIDYTQKLASYETVLWDTTNRKKAKNGNIVQLSDGKLSEMDISFAEMSGKWNTGEGKKKLKALGKEISNVIENDIITLQDGILPSSLPMQVQLGEKEIMVFQAYDGSKTTLNSTVLKYSIYENGMWSEPKAVLDDGCADMYADMKVVNNQVVLVWQKVKKEIAGDIEEDSKKVLKEIAENSEICFSVFDGQTNTFQSPVHITDNSYYDMMPRICCNNDDIIVSWVRNDKADLMQETGLNTIYTAKWNGSSFEKEEVLSNASGTIDDYIIYKDKNGIQSAFIGCSYGITAVFDTVGQVLPGLSELMSASEDSKISALNYIDGKVNCISNGLLYSYDTSNGAVVSQKAGESAFGSAVQYCTNGTKEGYIWSIYDEETGMGKIVASMATETGYSEPVIICEKEKVIWRYFSPVLDSDGNWKIIANALDVQNDINSLLFVTKSEQNKIGLAGASVDENDSKDGLTGIDYFVENTGDTTVHEIEVAVTLEDGKIISKTIPLTLFPGESKTGTAYLDLSSVVGKQTVKISVYTENQPDQTGCTVTDMAGLSDIQVTGKVEESSEDVTVTAVLANNSPMNTKTILHLYSDEKETTELAASDEVIVKEKENSELQFNVKKKDLEYNENHAIYLKLKAEVPDGDYNEDNNIAYVVLYDKTEEISPTPTTKPVYPYLPSVPSVPDTGSGSGSGTGSVAVPSSSPIPTASPTVKPTDVPVVTPGVPPTPEPAIKPSGIPDVIEEPSATVEPSAVPDEDKDKETSLADKLKRGSKVTDKKTKAVYKIIKTGKNKTVDYIKSTKKNPVSVTVPDVVKLKGKVYKVVSVGKGAFKNNKKLKTVKIGKNVKLIGKNAFLGCTGLKNVTMGKNIKTIGANAFNNCTALVIITIPAKVTKIGDKAFYKCKSLRYILVKPKKLEAKSIGNNAFGKGAINLRVKTDKSKWKLYSKIFTSKGMSEKALYIIDPVKLVV